jgi:hypothetical protein
VCSQHPHEKPPPPQRHRGVSAEKASQPERDGYILERWTLDLNCT